MNRMMLGLSVLLLILLAGLQWQNQRLQQHLEEGTQRIGALQTALTTRDDFIVQLQKQTQQRQRAEQALRQSLSNADRLVQRREQQLQRLTNENKKLRDWQDAAVPDDVIRLHQRPAFANVTDYLHWLSKSQQLPNPRQSP